MEVSCQLYAPDALLRGKRPPPPPGTVGQEAGWAPEPVSTIWRVENSYHYSVFSAFEGQMTETSGLYGTWPSRVGTAAIFLNSQLYLELSIQNGQPPSRSRGGDKRFLNVI
jgi:hypothetical protein